MKAAAGGMGVEDVGVDLKLTMQIGKTAMVEMRVLTIDEARSLVDGLRAAIKEATKKKWEERDG